ncbi:MAG: Txe/YoeB family addiction module toxin [Fibromonadales bacterium]|nr:Txe/YoeB family addiction module toxin [Fibromonadales bacterium]
MWQIVLSSKAKKQSKTALKSPYRQAIEDLMKIIAVNPFQTPPPYEKLEPPTSSSYSRRINKQHRLSYRVYDEDKVVKILSLWTHYE